MKILEMETARRQFCGAQRSGATALPKARELVPLQRLTAREKHAGSEKPAR
jgi:hypothetical protein